MIDGRNPRGRAAASWLAALTVCAAATAAPDRSRIVNVYAWSEYFPPAVIEKFQAASGLHVNLTVLDSPDMAETTLSAGSSNYDIVTMNASPQLAREIPKGFWRELDPALTPNARNADPRILNVLRAVDPGNSHAVPWMWGTIGILYNPDKIKAVMPAAPLDSLDLILSQEVAAKFAGCGISMLDSWGEVMPMVARYLGQPTLSAEPAKLDAVLAKLKEIKPLIRRVASSGYYQQLAEGDLCLALGYSGDAMVARRMAREGNTHVTIDYANVREMVPLFVDSMVVPADSPNAKGAFAFIDFMMRPEISAEVTRFIGFASGNAAAVPLLEPAVRDNAIVYPGASVRARFELQRTYSAEEIRAFSRAWQRFKTGS